MRPQLLDRSYAARLSAASLFAGLVTVLADPAAFADPDPETPTGEEFLVETEVSTEPVLIPELSTETSNTYSMPDGSLQLEGSVAPINYQDDDGAWNPIDTTLVDAPGTTYAVENAEAGYEVSIPANAATTPVRFEVDDVWVSLKMHGLSGPPQVEGDTATFQSVQNAESVELQATAGSIKESIMLTEPPSGSTLTYTYDLTTSPGLVPEVVPGVGVELTDADDVVRAMIPVGIMFDSANPAASASTGEYELVPDGTGWDLLMTPDIGWLTDAARAYPVTIDPQVTRPRQVRDCVLKANDPGNPYCWMQNDFIRAGRTDSAHRFRGLIEFDTSSIEPGSTINSAAMTLHVAAAQSSGTANYAVQAAGKPFNQYASWNSSGLNGPWDAGDPSGPAAVLPVSPGSNRVTFGGLGGTVQAWVNAPQSRTGFVVLPTAQEDKVAAFYPSTHSSAPYLDVNYEPVIPPTASEPSIHRCATPGKADGVIKVRVFNGGSAPYQMLVNINYEQKASLFVPPQTWYNYQFPDYGPGPYLVQVTGSPDRWIYLRNCEPEPYEPGRAVDTFPESAGQALPAVERYEDPADRIDPLSASDQSLPATTGRTWVGLTDQWPTTAPTFPVRVRTGRMIEPGSSVAAGTNAAGDDVRVDLAPQNTGSADSGTPSLQLKLRTITDNAATLGPDNDLDVQVNYAAFAQAYGGNWADRLQVMAYPGCYDTTPQTAGCSQSVVVPSVNDLGSQKLMFTATPTRPAGQTGPQAPPSAGALGSCFSAATAAGTVAGSDWDEEPVPADPITEFSTDGLPREDVDDPTFDDGDDADEPRDETTTGTSELPVVSVAAVPELATVASAASPCQGLTYRIEGGAQGFAMAAVDSIDAPSTSASSLQPSTNWQVGEGSGNFSWSYPIAMPPGIAGEAPSLALSYSSGSVDGPGGNETSQASAAGLGWSLEPGHISRTYASCVDDEHPDGAGDLCWRTNPSSGLVNDLSLVLEGRATKLIEHAPGQFRLQDDPGWRVEFGRGSTGWNEAELPQPDNADGDNEWFKITSPDGTRYIFGQGEDSVWTVPVRADETNEPCYEADPGPEIEEPACLQAWQWNLDRVVDANGNIVKYEYASESNAYQSSTVGKKLAYVRAGRLTGIKYGFARPGGPGSTGPARVEVAVESVDRCNSLLGPTATPKEGDPACRDQDGKMVKRVWPDTPTDLICTTESRTCKGTPVFFSTKRYWKITTRRGAQSALVDRYIFSHTMPDPDAVGSADEPQLWLNAVTHEGSTALTQVGGSRVLPNVEFDGNQRPNLVVAPTVEKDLQKFRLTRVRTEHGGSIDVEYGNQAQCAGEENKPRSVWNKKAWQSPGECFAARNVKVGEGQLEWYHKYLVRKVTLGDASLRLARLRPSDTSLGALRSYSYVYRNPSEPFKRGTTPPPPSSIGFDGWRFDSGSKNVPFKRRSWSDWRGYQTTLIKTMKLGTDANGSDPANPHKVSDKPRSIRRVVMYRGLSGTRISGAPGLTDDQRRPKRMVNTIEHRDQNANDDPRLEDRNPLQGRVVEETVLDPEASGAKHQWLTRTYRGYQAFKTGQSAVDLSSWFVGENFTKTHTRVKRVNADGTELSHHDRQHTVGRTFDNGGSDHRDLLLGVVKEVSDRGAGTKQTPAGDKNICTKTEWKKNANRWVRVPVEVKTYDNFNGQACNANTLRAQTRNYYDTAETQAENETKLSDGLLTRVDTRVSKPDDPGPERWITTRNGYDKYGRVTSSTDGRGHVTTTAYNNGNSDALPLALTVTTNAGTADARRAETVLETRRGLPTSIVVARKESTADDDAETTMQYDGYGRLVNVTKPEQVKAGGPASVVYDYLIGDTTGGQSNNRADSPAVVSTNVLRTTDGGTRDISYAVMDGWGRTIESQGPRPAGAGRVVSATAYDELGLPYWSAPVLTDTVPPGRVEDADGLMNADIRRAARSTETKHDAAGRTTSVVNWARNQSGDPAVHDTTTVIPQGDSTLTRPPVGGQTLTTVDGWGRTTRVAQHKEAAARTDAAEDTPENPAPTTLHAANYTYDGASNLTGISSNVNNGLGTWTYTYDLAGRRVATDDPDTGESTATYDDNGNQLTTENSTDGVVSTVYDDRDRPTKRYAGPAPVAGGPTPPLLAEWTYDQAINGDGQLYQSTSYSEEGADAHLGRYTQRVTGYDLNGNVLGMQYVYPLDVTAGPSTNVVTSQQTWTYNAADMVTSTQYPAMANLPAITVDTTYARNGQVDTMTAIQAGQENVTLLDTVYDKVGQPLRAHSIGDGQPDRHLQREYAWDNATGRLSRVGGTAFGTLDYTYDLVGNPLIVQAGNLYSNFESENAAWCYTYDALNRIETVRTRNGTPRDGSVPACTQQAAASNNLTGAHQNLRYNYANARLVNVTSNANGASHSSRYSYLGNGPHQTTKITTTATGSTEPVNPNDAALPPASDLVYDGAGRVQRWSTQGGETQYDYNPTGTLRSAATTGTAGSASAYAYDAGGIRVARRSPGPAAGSSMATFYMGNQERTITRSATAQLSQKARLQLTSPAGTPLAVAEGAGVTNRVKWIFLLSDAQQSVRYTRAQTGTVDTRPTYRPFGAAITTSNIGERGYLNKPLDPNGDIRLEHRNYQPSLNVLTTPDALLMPIVDPQTLNPYGYAANNPISGSDPSGLCTVHSDGECVGGPPADGVPSPPPPPPSDEELDDAFHGLVESSVPSDVADTIIGDDIRYEDDPKRQETLRTTFIATLAMQGDTCKDMWWCGWVTSPEVQEIVTLSAGGGAGLLRLALARRVAAGSVATTTTRGGLRIIGGGFSTSERYAAETLAGQGRNVVLREADSAAGRTSDLLVDDIPYDVYTPLTGNLDRIVSSIASKGPQVRGGGVVLDLSRSPLTAEQVGNILPRVQGASSQISDIIVLGGRP